MGRLTSFLSSSPSVFLNSKAHTMFHHSESVWVVDWVRAKSPSGRVAFDLTDKGALSGVDL